MNSADELYMRRAFDLALRGIGSVSPNPLVGCVIVRDGIVIGEGWHQQFGGPHAEVNAVNSVKDATMLIGSTVYVTLEPCSHFGKTPPCADMLVKEKVGKVVVANGDPNPLVQGKGIEKLKAAGIEVVTDVLAKEGKRINGRFFTFINNRRPYVILKWAQTADGFIARDNFDSKWISNVHSRQLVHQWRAAEDAVLVGKQTALHDNPRLNVRDWQGRDPVRVVIDRNLSLPASLNLFDGTQPTICYNTVKDDSSANVTRVKLVGENFFTSLLADLYSRNIQSVMVEGGSQTINQFIAGELWDEARVFTADTKFGSGIAAPQLKAKPESTLMIEGDRLEVYFKV
jgi:diaminohydroxyphosphoribosylaminopyrimidine deaminase/5-amino-6-(5-phosphoribosylamino)uracil reductase